MINLPELPDRPVRSNYIDDTQYTAQLEDYCTIIETLLIKISNSIINLVERLDKSKNEMV